MGRRKTSSSETHRHAFPAAGPIACAQHLDSNPARFNALRKQIAAVEIADCNCGTGALYLTVTPWAFLVELRSDKTEDDHAVSNGRFGVGFAFPDAIDKHTLLAGLDDDVLLHLASIQLCAGLISQVVRVGYLPSAPLVQSLQGRMEKDFITICESLQASARH